MAPATIAPPTIKTLADLRKRLGGIAVERIWFHPAPGKQVWQAGFRDHHVARRHVA
jgi:hypothetical protein